jgi:ectoine hydroxylase-related dioxygenase (phytanoyl-CoA dioxygenase family)
MKKCLVTLPREASIDDIREVLELDGGVILEDLVTVAQLDRVAEDLAPYFAKAMGNEVDRLAGVKTHRLGGLVVKSRACIDIMMEPRLLAVAESVLTYELRTWFGEERVVNRSSVQISDTTAISIQPGERAQGLHRDDVAHYRRHPGPDSQILALIAATAFTAQNGATNIIPGSHRWDDDRMPRQEEAVRAEMKRGSGVVYLGSTYHGGGANTSQAARTGLGFVYAPAFMRQVENQYLAIPVEQIRNLPPEVRKLVGYSLSEPYCGYWELGDPGKFLEVAKPVS